MLGSVECSDEGARPVACRNFARIVALEPSRRWYLRNMSRRTLAVSVVVTISLADVGCTASSEPTRNPPPDAVTKTEPVTKPPPEREPINSNPPGPSADDGEPVADDGKPAADDGGAADGGVVAPPKEQIHRLPDGTCERIVDVVCDPGDSCNPPAPEIVPCPLPVARDPSRVKLRGEECWESFAGNCPPDAKCNPPPPQQVQCPDGIKAKAVK